MKCITKSCEKLFGLVRESSDLMHKRFESLLINKKGYSRGILKMKSFTKSCQKFWCLVSFKGL